MAHQDASPSSFSSEWWRVTLSSIGDGVIATDRQGKVTFLNLVAQALTGWTQEEAEGRLLEEIFVIVSETTRAKVENPVAKVLQTGYVVGLANHTVLMSRDGREIPIDDSGAPIRDESGQLVGVVLIFRDITERRRTELAQAHLAAIIESSDDAIIGKTLDSVITSWNKGAEKVLGYTAEESIGQPITILIPPHRQGEEAEILERLKQGECIDHYETVRVRKDGTQIIVSLTISPIRDAAGKIIGASKILRDITEQKKAGEALRQSEKLFHMLADSAPVMVWMSGRDKLCTFFNRPWLDFTGRSMEQEIGNGWTEQVHPEDFERCFKTYSTAFDQRVEFEMEYRLRRWDGEHRWVLDKGAPLYNPEGIFTGYIGSCLEISERKQAEEKLRAAQEQLRLVTDNMAAAVTRCNRDLHYVWVSPVYAGWLGRTPEEIAGRPILEVIGQEGYESILPYMRQVLAGQKVEYEIQVNFQGRGECWIHAVYVPTSDRTGSVDGWVAVVTDMTERKMAEKERELLLERERRVRARAEEASRLKDEFLATVSHELRSPLNGILGWASLLHDGSLGENQARQAIETIERNARTQAQLIEDLLDVSRIITGQLRLNVRPVMAAAVVESAIASLIPAAHAKGVRIQSLLDPDAGPISGDSGRLQQVIWNLLSNAIKFTPKGGRVQVRVERINAHIEMIVSDTGQGISPEFLPHVFDRFRQADGGTTRMHGGLGLGLAIVRHLVELHGGTVTADSLGQDRGATFTVKLPLMVIPARRDEESQVPSQVEAEISPLFSGSPKLEGVKVLIIDDESDARNLLRTVLEYHGAEVRDAGSAAQGLREAQEWRPSIVVSDLGMPDEDGYQFIEKFRAWERESGTRTPAVALTAYARTEDRMRALAAGYQVHLAKPIDPVEFALIVASQLGRIH